MTGQTGEPIRAPRLPLREPPYPPEVAKLVENSAFAGLSPGKLRKALAHHPDFARTFQAMAHVVLFKSAVDMRAKEIGIMRTGALNGAEYMWGMHVSIYGAEVGLDDAAVRDLTTAETWKDLKDPRWTDRERLVIRMADELHGCSTVSDTVWDGLCAEWPTAQVIELLFASSFYTMASYFLNCARVPLEEGQARFPEGRKPAEAPEA